MLVRCAWCGRYEFGDEWLDLGDDVRAHLSTSLARRASDGICPDCFRRLERRKEGQ